MKDEREAFDRQTERLQAATTHAELEALTSLLARRIILLILLLGGSVQGERG